MTPSRRRLQFTVHSRFRSASARAARARWILALSFLPSSPRRCLAFSRSATRFPGWPRPRRVCRAHHRALAIGDQPLLLKREDALALQSHRVQIDLRAGDLGLCGADLRRRDRADILRGRGQIRLRLRPVDLVGSPVDPDQNASPAETTSPFSTSTSVTVPVTCGTIWVATALTRAFPVIGVMRSKRRCTRLRNRARIATVVQIVRFIPPLPLPSSSSWQCHPRPPRSLHSIQRLNNS